MKETETLEATSHLRDLPFVKALSTTVLPEDQYLGFDGKAKIQTPNGPFTLWLEVKRSFLTRSAINQLLAYVKHLPEGKIEHVLVLARHIPRPIAQELIKANVNFADDAGNVHLQLGDTYSWTAVGLPA